MMLAYLFIRKRRLQFLLAIWFVCYYMQANSGILKALSNMGLVLWTGYAFYFMLSRLSKRDTPFLYKITASFLILQIIYYLWGEFVFCPIPSVFAHLGRSQIKNMVCCLFPFFVAYEAGRKEKLSPQIFLLFLLPAYVFSFYQVEFDLVQLFDKRIQNNVIYRIILLSPYVFLLQNIFLEIPLFGYFGYMLFYAAKRGAVLCFLGIISLWFVEIVFAKGKNIFKTLIYALIIAYLSILATMWIKDYVESDALLQARIQATEKDSSGGRHYDDYFQLWQDASPSEKVFGLGYAATAQYDKSNEYAHNDWLEILVNCGILGIVFFVLLYFGLLRLCFARNLLLVEKLAVIAALWLFFSKGLTTGGITNDVWTSFFLFGFFLSKTAKVNETLGMSAPDVSTAAISGKMRRL